MKIHNDCPSFLSFVSVLLLSTIAAASAATGPLVYIGTYTGAKSKGIYVYRMDPATGALASLGLAYETQNPTFLAVHPNHRFLYSANEVGNYNGKPSGFISAFAIDAETGKLTLLNQQPSGGGGPCHLTVDPAGKWVFVANYGGGSISVLPIQEDGKLGDATAFVQHKGSSVDSRRQQGPHAHGIYLDPAGKHVAVADLGLDQVLVYRFDSTKGTLEVNAPPAVSVKPGAGPRHFAFHPSGRFGYVINELDSTMTVFSYDGTKGVLKEIQAISTLPTDFGGKSYPAEVEVHRSGKFLYGSNRGHDSIVLFTIDQATGKITPVGYQSTQGKNPRHFGIDPSGQYLYAANQNTDNIVTFRIDPQTGRLNPLPQVLQAGAPVCVVFVPTDK